MTKKKNNPSPYPSILFHFTNIGGLRGILASGFHPALSRERLEIESTTREFTVPIVSFCDLRLSELPIHMDKYGEFGIGMSKAWATSSGLNPLIYINKKSEFTINLVKSIDNLFSYFEQGLDDNLHQFSDTYMGVLNSFRYMKNYEGDLYRKGKLKGNYRFADEREWRYAVPKTAKQVEPFYPIATANHPDHSARLHDILKQFPLRFNATDVEYLVVPKEKNIIPLRTHIRKLSSTFSESEIEHLVSRILTARQIRSDM